MLSADEWQTLWLSLRVASVAVLMCLPLALFTAWLLARVEFGGKLLVDAVVHLPLTLPPVVTGYLLLLLLGRRAPLGSWLEEQFGWVFAFRWTGAALAGAVMGFPLCVRAIRQGLDALDPRLEEAAASLGASPVWVFVTVTLPLLMPALLSGTILAFARTLGEFGATVSFVSSIPGETRTLSSAIYAQLQSPGGEAAAGRLTAVSIALSLGALLASEALARYSRRRLQGA